MVSIWGRCILYFVSCIFWNLLTVSIDIGSISSLNIFFFILTCIAFFVCAFVNRWRFIILFFNTTENYNRSIYVVLKYAPSSVLNKLFIKYFKNKTIIISSNADNVARVNITCGHCIWYKNIIIFVIRVFDELCHSICAVV